MTNIEALRQEIVDANVFALLAANDTARLMMAQAARAGKNSSPFARGGAQLRLVTDHPRERQKVS